MRKFYIDKKQVEEKDYKKWRADEDKRIAEKQKLEDQNQSQGKSAGDNSTNEEVG